MISLPCRLDKSTVDSLLSQFIGSGTETGPHSSTLNLSGYVSAQCAISNPDHKFYGGGYRMNEASFRILVLSFERVHSLSCRDAKSPTKNLNRTELVGMELF